MTDQQTDSTDSAENTVSRRKFMEGLGLTAAGASAGVVIGVALPVGSEAASLPAQPTYEWVRAHSGNKMNEFVDLLAYTCSTGYPYDD